MSRRKLLKKIAVVVSGFFAPVNLTSFTVVKKESGFQSVHNITVPQSKLTNGSKDALKNKPSFMDKFIWRKICSYFPPIAFTHSLDLDQNVWENLLRVHSDFIDKHLMHLKILQKKNVFLICYNWDSRESYCNYYNQINAYPFHNELKKNNINFITLKGKWKYLKDPML